MFPLATMSRGEVGKSLCRRIPEIPEIRVAQDVLVGEMRPAIFSTGILAGDQK